MLRLQTVLTRQGLRLLRAKASSACSSETGKLHGQHVREEAVRARYLPDISVERSHAWIFPEAISFEGTVTAFSAYRRSYSKGTSLSHVKACSQNIFRSFHGRRQDQHLQVRPNVSNASLKQKRDDNETLSEAIEENDAALAVFQGPKDILEGFYEVVNKVKASGNAADMKSLRRLESMLAQAESVAAGDDQRRIGQGCTTLAELFSVAKDPVTSLQYAQKGFEALRRIRDPDAKYEACRCIYSMMITHCATGDYEKALKQAEHLQLILQHLRKNNFAKDLSALTFGCQAVLIKCKTSLGMVKEVLPHFEKYVMLKERMVPRDEESLGAAYIQAAEAFQVADQPAEAVHFALKGLNIHIERFGSGSYEVAFVRALLSQAYHGLGLFEECLAEYDKARPILETIGSNSIENMATFILKSVFSLIELYRYESAMTRLDDLIKRTGRTSRAHASALVTLAKVYSLSNMRNELFECCENTLHVLENDQEISIVTGEYICSLASAYETQNLYDEAIKLYKKAWLIFRQFSGDEVGLKAADTEGEIGITLLRAGNFSQAAPFLKNYAMKNRSILGPDSIRVMVLHNRVGAEYLQAGQIKEALEQLETAKLLLPKESTEIDDAIMLSLYQNLATAYKATRRLENAIDCQKAALNIATNSDFEDKKSLIREIEKSLDLLMHTQSEITGKCKVKS